MHKSTLCNWLLLLGTLVACGVIGEVMARMLMPAPLLWLQPQVRYVSSPTLGFRMEPNQSTFTADKPCSTNRHGLRGPEVSWQKPLDVKRLLVLGDSIAFGFGVREASTFARRLEGLLNQAQGQSRWEVINAGVSAYNTTIEVDYFFEEGIRFHPDQVVLAFYWNDIHDKSEVVVDDAGRLRERSDPQPLSAWQAWLNSPQIYNLRNMLKRSRLFYTVVERLRYVKLWLQDESPFRETQIAMLHGLPNTRVEQGWQEVERQLVRLNTYCRSHGIDLQVVVMPMAEQLKRIYTKIQYQSVLKAICIKNDLQCLDLMPRFQSVYQDHTSLYISYDGDHPNEHGHRLIAEELMRVIGSQ
jgi:lysophospholipase L1-like esterase